MQEDETAYGAEATWFKITEACGTAESIRINGWVGGCMYVGMVQIND
jgi:hypothetical protein